MVTARVDGAVSKVAAGAISDVGVRRGQMTPLGIRQQPVESYDFQTGGDRLSFDKCPLVTANFAH